MIQICIKVNNLQDGNKITSGEIIYDLKPSSVDGSFISTISDWSKVVDNLKYIFNNDVGINLTDTSDYTIELKLNYEGDIPRLNDINVLLSDENSDLTNIKVLL